MNNENLLEKTQYEWLRFILKVEKEIRKKDKELSKIPVEQYLKLIKGIKPKYYRNDVLLDKKPDRKKSCLTVYEGKDIVVKDSYKGEEDEPDIRDRTEYLYATYGDTTVSYRVKKYYEGASFRLTVDGVDIIVKSTYDWGCGIDFLIDLGNHHLAGNIGHYTYSINFVNASIANERNAKPSDIMSIFRCTRKKARLDVAEKAAMETLKEFGMTPPDPMERFIKQGYRTQEQIEAEKN